MNARNIIMACLLSATTSVLHARTLAIKEVRFHEGDNPAWASPKADDSSWKTMDMHRSHTVVDMSKPHSYAWYRIHFTLPRDMYPVKTLTDSVTFDMGRILDVDETYLNGMCIGKTGDMPADPTGVRKGGRQWRRYTLEADNEAIKWGEENVLAVRVYCHEGGGGMTLGGVHVVVATPLDGLKWQSAISDDAKGQGSCRATIVGNGKKSIQGRLTVTARDMASGTTRTIYDRKCTLGKQPITVALNYDCRALTRVEANFVDAKTGRKVSRSYYPKYLTTPQEPLEPRYNGPLLYGARPGSPIVFKLAVSGEKPMRYSVRDLPQGLRLDADKGIVTGSLDDKGDYHITLVAENSHGRVEQPFIIRIGSKIGLTPPMGWSSWNCFGTHVSQEMVTQVAQAIMDNGIADYGYTYINIDDAWEAAERNADGTISPNDKFPDMKGLADWLHANGLKMGIYSSPGDMTCGGWLGSLGHERQDAEAYANWGVDYLKYDWCDYQKEFEMSRDVSVAAYIYPYMLMEKCLREQPRDIFYSLCQYGDADVWKWGRYVDGNSWRTTGDMSDNWQSLYDTGFVRQVGLSPYSGPGHWNDPDMLHVGMKGWGNGVYETQLTPVEQYTHITLWSLLASNMIMGCNVTEMDAFTFNLLCNNEVVAVNQDTLGIQADQSVVDGDVQVWSRPLSDGTIALGIFNLGETDTEANLADYQKQMGIQRIETLRDLWRQRDLKPTATHFFLPSHGCVMLKLKAQGSLTVHRNRQ